MKVLISSRYAGGNLKAYLKDNLNTLYIRSFKSGGVIEFTGSAYTITLNCEVIEQGECPNPTFRIDWLAEALCAISEQPCVIHIRNTRNVDLILQY